MCPRGTPYKYAPHGFGSTQYFRFILSGEVSKKNVENFLSVLSTLYQKYGRRVSVCMYVCPPSEVRGRCLPSSMNPAIPLHP